MYAGISISTDAILGPANYVGRRYRLVSIAPTISVDVVSRLYVRGWFGIPDFLAYTILVVAAVNISFVFLPSSISIIADISLAHRIHSRLHLIVSDALVPLFRSLPAVGTLFGTFAFRWGVHSCIVGHLRAFCALPEALQQTSRNRRRDLSL